MAPAHGLRGALLVGVAMTALVGAAVNARADGEGYMATEHQRRTVYHSPQKPGFTCWVGAWGMPGGDLMVCFTQATGPVEGRERAPEEVRKRLNWPPAGQP